MAVVLVVDDNRDNIFLLEMILRGEGHEVISAESGIEALKILESRKPDIILLDVMMPEMDGFETCRRIRDDRANKTIPVVMVTAKKKEIDEVVHGLNVGADDYILKPFNNSELVARVGSMLRVKQLHDENERLVTALETKNRQFEEELRLAQRYQTAMLPTSFPYTDKINYSHLYIPTSALGGDYYDAIPYPNGKLGIIIADVTGHGPSAALIVAMMKTLVMTHMRSDGDLAGNVTRLNNDLAKLLPEGIFVSAFFGLLDIASGGLEYVLAGHPHPFLMRKTAGRVDRLTKSNMVLGAFDGIKYTGEKTTMEKGDSIFLYSDGLYEVFNSAGEQYGLERVESYLAKNMREPAEKIMDSLIADVKSHSARDDFDDDIAILISELKP